MNATHLTANHLTATHLTADSEKATVLDVDSLDTLEACNAGFDHAENDVRAIANAEIDRIAELMRILFEHHGSLECELFDAVEEGNLVVHINAELNEAATDGVDAVGRFSAQLFGYMGRFEDEDRLPLALEDPFDKRLFGDLPPVGYGHSMQLTRHEGWILSPLNEVYVSTFAPGSTVDESLPLAVQDAVRWYGLLGRSLVYVEVMWEDESAEPVLDWFLGAVLSVLAPSTAAVIRRSPAADHVSVLVSPDTTDANYLII